MPYYIFIVLADDIVVNDPATEHSAPSVEPLNFGLLLRPSTGLCLEQRVDTIILLTKHVYIFSSHACGEEHGK